MSINKVVFFRRRRNIFYRYEGKIYLYREGTMTHLKDSLSLPFTIEFYGITYNGWGWSILKELCDKCVDIECHCVSSMKFPFFHLVAECREKKYKVGVYQVSLTMNMYNSMRNHTPYVLVDMQGKKALLETTMNHVKNTGSEFYFLADDLDVDERTFFEDCYKTLDCDYVYELSDAEYSESEFKKALYSANHE